jgi:SAM-dependent methyltransferase
MPAKNWLIFRIHDRALRELASQHFHGRLVDIGCGTKPYRAMMRPLVDQHVGVDHRASFHDPSNVDLFGTAYEVPAAEGDFDCALCTSVLEHLEEPEAAVRECHRLLKAGGVAVYSMPFIWHLHEEPRDFYRYTKYGLKHLFEKSGFDIIQIKALSGFFTTFGTLLAYYVMRLNRGPLRWTGLVPLMAFSFQLAAWALDKVSRDERYTWMYMVVARKRPAAALAKAA